jgi:hypothetical protein
MPVDRCDAFIGIWLQQFASNDFLDRQNNSIPTPYADRCSPILNRFYRILDLEIPAIWRED